jgi:hypothetical protein
MTPFRSPGLALPATREPFLQIGVPGRVPIPGALGGELLRSRARWQRVRVTKNGSGVAARLSRGSRPAVYSCEAEAKGARWRVVRAML